tara:strand:+ start:235 stop:888 length:654 start_codon:yes stop_codon:yes gene_type:complete
MKLLFENWRKYLKEVDEPDIVAEPVQGTRPDDPEEEEETPEGKIIRLFASNPHQAIELAKALAPDVGPQLVNEMESAVTVFHDLMRVFVDPDAKIVTPLPSFGGHRAITMSGIGEGPWLSVKVLEHLNNIYDTGSARTRGSSGNTWKRQLLRCWELDDEIDEDQKTCDAIASLVEDLRVSHIDDMKNVRQFGSRQITAPIRHPAYRAASAWAGEPPR